MMDGWSQEAITGSIQKIVWVKNFDQYRLQVSVSQSFSSDFVHINARFLGLNACSDYLPVHTVLTSEEIEHCLKQAYQSFTSGNRELCV